MKTAAVVVVGALVVIVVVIVLAIRGCGDNATPTVQSTEVAQLKRQNEELQKRIEKSEQERREALNALGIKAAQANAARIASEAEARGNSADTSIRAVVGRAADVSAVVSAAGELAKKKDANDVAFVEMSTSAPARSFSAVEVQQQKNNAANKAEQRARLEDQINLLKKEIGRCDTKIMSMERLINYGRSTRPETRAWWRSQLEKFNGEQEGLRRKLAETQVKLAELH